MILFEWSWSLLNEQKLQAHTFNGILLKGSITSANDTGRWKTPSHPKEWSAFTTTQNLYSSSPRTPCDHLLIIIILWWVMSLIAPAGLTVSHWVGMATRKARAQTRQTPPTVPQPKQQLRLGSANQGLKKRKNFCRTFTTSRQFSEQPSDWKFIVDQIGKNTTSKVTVSTLLQRIIYLGLNLSGITSITAAVA